MSKSKNFYLCVIDVLRTGKLSDVCARFGMSKYSASYHVSKLRRLGIVEKRGYGVWKINDSMIYMLKDINSKQVKKIELSRSSLFKRSTTNKILTSRVRSHAFQFVLKVGGVTGWVKKYRRSYLDSKGVVYKALRQGESLLVGGCKVWTTDRSVVVWLPQSYFVDNAEVGFRFMVDDFLKVVRGVERLFNVSFRLGGKYRFKNVRMHNALVKNALAEQYNRDKQGLYVFDERGCWLWVDDSGGLAELETGRASGEGVEASLRVQAFFNGVKSTGLTPEGILEMFGESAKLQAMYAENMRSHVDAVKSLAEGVRELRREIKRFGSR